MSTIPFDLVAYFSATEMDGSAAVSAVKGQDTEQNLKLFRMLKTIKLSKLVRVLKLMKTIGRFVSSVKSTTAFAIHIYKKQNPKRIPQW